MPELRQLRRKTEIRRFQEGSPLGDTELVVWLQDWSDPFNVGGMFRVADAAGVSQLILSGKTPQPPDDGIAKTGMIALQIHGGLVGTIRYRNLRIKPLNAAK
jgi:tRNA (guanosine-2'-O-)-methyltransferase